MSKTDDQKKRHLIETIDEWLEDASDRIGLIGTGSFFTGDSGPASDVDLTILKNTQYYEKKVVKKDGILFDLTICSPKALVWFCNKSYNKAHWTESLMVCEVLEDPSGQIAKFLQRLEATRQHIEASPQQIKQLKGTIANNLRKLQQHQDLALLQMRTYTDWLISAYQLLCLDRGLLARQHPPRICKHINEEFPQLSKFVDTAWHNQLPTEFINTLTEFTEDLLSSIAPEIDEIGVYKRQELPSA